MFEAEADSTRFEIRLTPANKNSAAQRVSGNEYQLFSILSVYTLSCRNVNAIDFIALSAVKMKCHSIREVRNSATYYAKKVLVEFDIVLRSSSQAQKSEMGMKLKVKGAYHAQAVCSMSKARELVPDVAWSQS